MLTIWMTINNDHENYMMTTLTRNDNIDKEKDSENECNSYYYESKDDVSICSLKNILSESDDDDSNLGAD